MGHVTYILYMFQKNTAASSKQAHSLPGAVDVGSEDLDKSLIHPLAPLLLISPAACTAAAARLATQPACSAATHVSWAHH
jgi:hypothetical protein